MASLVKERKMQLMQQIKVEESARRHIGILISYIDRSASFLVEAIVMTIKAFTKFRSSIRV
jgi:hypothetical protein